MGFYTLNRRVFSCGFQEWCNLGVPCMGFYILNRSGCACGIPSLILYYTIGSMRSSRLSWWARFCIDRPGVVSDLNPNETTILSWCRILKEILLSTAKQIFKTHLNTKDEKLTNLRRSHCKMLSSFHLNVSAISVAISCLTWIASIFRYNDLTKTTTNPFILSFLLLFKSFVSCHMDFLPTFWTGSLADYIVQQ